MSLDENKISGKFKFLTEYNYYAPINEAPDEETDSEDNLEAGDDLEDDNFEEPNLEDSGDEDLGGEDLEDDMPDDFEEDEPNDFDTGKMAEEPIDSGDEVEVDVSEIVDGVDKNSEEINNINSKLDTINTQLSQYINQMTKTNNSIAAQVGEMEKNISKEFIKRAPTPHEQLMMRSMSSYPYNQQLTDYWKPAKGNEYEETILNPNDSKKIPQDEKPKEYKLTTKDIDDDYSEYDVKASL